MTIAVWLVISVYVLILAWSTVYYLRIRKSWERLPIVAAEITCSKINRYDDEIGNFHYEADIRIAYRFRGKQLESDCAVLRNIELLTPYNYNGLLVEKYRVGDIVNVRVVPIEPYPAYLEIAPLSKVALIFVPLAFAFFVFLFFGFASFFVSGFQEMTW